MLQVGIVGLPNVGKSTLFNAITKNNVDVANYPFATIDKNVGVVAVPDDRLAALQKLYIKKDRVPPIVPTTMEFVDIAGLVKGASHGEGLGNQFLANIREVATIAHVVRCFDNDNVVHVSGKIDPLDDIKTINSELMLADIQSLENRLVKLRRSAKANKEDAILVKKCEEVIEYLFKEVPARLTGIELPKELNLLSAKPIIYVCNVNEEDALAGNDYVNAVKSYAQKENAEVIILCNKVEHELTELDEVEGLEYLRSLGLEEPSLNRLIRVGYKTLGLITFLTAGEKEVRAWTTLAGNKAPAAAGEIHTDFERGFIRAEVIQWHKLVEAGSIAEAKSRGWLRTEGKYYLVEDGDVIHFLFNV